MAENTAPATTRLIEYATTEADIRRDPLIVDLVAALEVSEAARANLEAIVAEVKERCEEAAGTAGIIDANWILRRLYRAE